MAAGAVSLDQARVIVRYVGVLAKELAAPLVARGEADMIGYCAQLDPVLLGVVGRRLAELVDPEGTQDRDEADAVDREAKATAARTATLTPYDDKPGGILRAVLDAEDYATVAAWLDAAAAPPPPDPDGIRDPRSPGQRRADALLAACEQSLAGGRERARGGVKPRIIVTIPLSSLLGSTGHGLTQPSRPGGRARTQAARIQRRQTPRQHRIRDTQRRTRRTRRGDPSSPPQRSRASTRGPASPTVETRRRNHHDHKPALAGYFSDQLLHLVRHTSRVGLRWWSWWRLCGRRS